MKITKEADYALRIVAKLAKNGQQMEAKKIAEENGIPYRFTLKILRKIVQAGYLRSFRGVNGGYALNKPAEEITLRNIIEVIDGPIALNLCLGGEACEGRTDCRVRNRLAIIQQMLIRELDAVSFKDIING